MNHLSTSALSDPLRFFSFCESVGKEVVVVVAVRFRSITKNWKQDISNVKFSVKYKSLMKPYKNEN